MSRKKKLIPSSFGGGTFTTFKATVQNKPELEFGIDPDGEIFPRVKERPNPAYITLPLLTDKNGWLVFPANLYLHHLASTTNEQSTLNTHAQALLLFYRFLSLPSNDNHKPTSIYDCSRDVENGAVYAFRDFMLKNLKKDIEVDGKLITKGLWEPSTAATYVSVIIRFYQFMNNQRIIRITKEFVPFEYIEKRVPINSRSYNKEHDSRSHTKSNSRKEIIVQTTTLLKPFKGERVKAKSSHKLTPMLEDQKRIFYEHLKLNGNFEAADEVKDLMLYLATETGLRLEELVTFPCSAVVYPTLDETPVLLSPTRNGCMTKFDKARTITIPKDVMNLLFKYKTSAARKRALSNSLIKHNCLFVMRSEGRHYSPNTIEKHFEKIRNKIRSVTANKDYSNWYFTVHDTRATFATNWIYVQVLTRNLLPTFLLDELAELMGHEDTSITSKYIKYMENDKNWKEFAHRKNAQMKAIMGC
ncbi:site-specific integrase [Vibrio aestuarianus]|uniref:site-specific integrase n=1 Tax=Vibrio aestuarianus TaxID=28171 RepID=UPI00237D0D08|nr:site-specific integrase [Vibrio aestuarianus]MDE1318236.1 site-specific integrase [Vibrio aestuarianus]